MQKIFLSTFLMISLAFGVFLSFSSVSADDLQKKEGEREELVKERDAIQKQLEQKASEANSISSQISSLESRSASLEKSIEKNKDQISVVEDDMSSIDKQIKEKDDLLSIQKEVLAGLLEAYYDKNEDFIYVAMALGYDPIASGDYMDQVRDEVEVTLNNIIELKQELKNDKDELLIKKEEIINLKEQLEQKNIYLESSKNQKSVLLAQTKSEESRYKIKLSKVEKDLRDIEQEIEAIEAIKSGNLDLGELPSAHDGYFSYPVSGARISQYYGKTTFTRWYTFHNGVDFAASTGTKIKAVRSGKVVATGNNGRYAYGKWVAVDHGDGLVTLYGHMSKQSVSKGDRVDEGEKLGEIGSTGYSTGPHLHFSVFSENSFEVVNSSTVSGLKIPTGAHMDPMRYL